MVMLNFFYLPSYRSPVPRLLTMMHAVHGTALESWRAPVAQMGVAERDSRNFMKENVCLIVVEQ